jgi:hypothetical protein
MKTIKYSGYASVKKGGRTLKRKRQHAVYLIDKKSGDLIGRVLGEVFKVF